MCSVFLSVTISGLAAESLVQWIGKFFYNIPSAEMMDSAVSGSYKLLQKEGRKSLTAEVNLTVNLGLETPRRNTLGVSVKMSLQRFL